MDEGRVRQSEVFKGEAKKEKRGETTLFQFSRESHIRGRKSIRTVALGRKKEKGVAQGYPKGEKRRVGEKSRTLSQTRKRGGGEGLSHKESRKGRRGRCSSAPRERGGAEGPLCGRKGGGGKGERQTGGRKGIARKSAFLRWVCFRLSWNSREGVGEGGKKVKTLKTLLASLAKREGGSHQEKKKK